MLPRRHGVALSVGTACAVLALSAVYFDLPPAVLRSVPCGVIITHAAPPNVSVDLNLEADLAKAEHALELARAEVDDAQKATASKVADLAKVTGQLFGARNETARALEALEKAESKIQDLESWALKIVASVKLSLSQEEQAEESDFLGDLKVFKQHMEVNPLPFFTQEVQTSWRQKGIIIVAGGAKLTILTGCVGSM